MLKKRSFHVLLSVLFILVLLSIAGCSSSEQQFKKMLDSAVKEPVTYTTYSNDGFSIQYPYWPDADNGDSSIEIFVTKGFCSAVINTESIPALHMYRAIVYSVQNINESAIIMSGDDDYHLKFTGKFKNFTTISDVRIYECNDKATAVTLVCLLDVEPEVQQIHDTVFRSANCVEHNHKALGEISDLQLEQQSSNVPDKIETAEVLLKNPKTVEYSEDDFVVTYPEWNAAEDSSGDERVIGVSTGLCSVVVNKYSSLLDHMAYWINKTVSDKEDNRVLSFSENSEHKELVYTFPYNGALIKAKADMIYCNHMTYVTNTICVDDYSEYIDKLGVDSVCKKNYVLLTTDEVAKKAEEIKTKFPKEFEHAETIVNTEVGDKYRLNLDAIVYFINNNPFLVNIAKDFTYVDVVFDDAENYEQISLKITIDAGKIIDVSDGTHSFEGVVPDVTVIVPMRDAENILNNAENLDSKNIISLAVRVQTDPPEVKQDVIRNILGGKYTS